MPDQQLDCDNHRELDLLPYQSSTKVKTIGTSLLCLQGAGIAC